MKEYAKEIRENKKRVLDEEAYEFLKLIKQSEYKVVDQLNRISAKISILSLMLSSEPHRRLLLKILKEAMCPTTLLLKSLGVLLAISLLTIILLLLMMRFLLRGLGIIRLYISLLNVMTICKGSNCLLWMWCQRPSYQSCLLIALIWNLVQWWWKLLIALAAW